mgnify:CR=1 FL=1
MGHGGEIVLSETMVGDPDVARLLADGPIVEDAAQLKGFDERVRFHRLPAAPEPATAKIGGMP